MGFPLFFTFFNIFYFFCSILLCFNVALHLVSLACSVTLRSSVQSALRGKKGRDVRRRAKRSRNPVMSPPIFQLVGSGRDRTLSPYSTLQWSVTVPWKRVITVR